MLGYRSTGSKGAGKGQLSVTYVDSLGCARYIPADTYHIYALMFPPYTHRILCHYSGHGRSQKGYNYSLQKQDNTHTLAIIQTIAIKEAILVFKSKGRLSISDIWRRENNYHRSTFHLFGRFKSRPLSDYVRGKNKQKRCRVKR